MVIFNSNQFYGFQVCPEKELLYSPPFQQADEVKTMDSRKRKDNVSIKTQVKKGGYR